jgi:hypothetical protein
MRHGRSSGIVVAAPMTAIPRLPESSSFASVLDGQAFWVVRERANRTGRLFVSSGLRILRDLRAQCDVATVPFAWSAALFDAAADRAETMGYSGTLPALSSGDPLPRAWLRLILWLTYSATDPNAEVVLPTRIEVPRLSARQGGDPVSAAETRVTADRVDFRALEGDPFGLGETGFDVTANARKPKKSSDLKWFAMAGAAWLLATGGR